MKNYKTGSETFWALASVCCLLFIKYYEAVLYYQNINLIADTIYGLMAIPLFYFFVSSCLATIFIKIFDLPISRITKCIYRAVDIFLLLIYMVLITLKLLGFITIGIIPFVSIYWVIFIAWGCIFAIDVNVQLKKRETV